MAAATLKIDYIATYPDGHRICYRKTTDPPGAYTCIDAGPGLGALSESIPITLEPDSCEAIIYEGYVQALCQPYGSGVGEVPFTTVYTPAEACYSARIECIESDIVGALGSSDGFDITDRGAGYDVPPAAAPAVTFDSGAATADAYISDDGVKTLDFASIVDPGGHAGGPFTFVGVAVTGTTGAGDIANTFVDVEIDGANNIIAVTVTDTPDLHTNIGSGHVAGDTLTLGGVGGGPPTLIAGTTIDVDTLYATGELLEILLTANDNYAATPNIVIDPPPGPSPKQATADVLMNPCTAFNKIQCDTNPSVPNIQLELGESLIVCGQKATYPFPEIIAVPDYSMIHDGCCYDGYQYTFTNNEASNVTLTYLDHATGQWSTSVLVPAVPQVICVTEDAYFFDDASANVTVIIGAAC